MPPVSFISSALAAPARPAAAAASSFCGQCVRRPPRRRAARVARRPRVRLPARAAAAAAGNGVVPGPRGGAAGGLEGGDSGGDGEEAGRAAAGATAFSAADAGNSLVALGREYVRLGRSERFILWRLAGALALVVLSKFIGLVAPFLYKRAVDTLSVPGVSVGLFAGILLLHFAAKILTSVTRELRNGVFVRAGQRVGRRITGSSFAHILAMEAAFHGASQTGALTRVIDRGTRSIMTILRGVLFSFFPTLLELVLVCAVLFTSFSGWYVVATIITFAAYLKFTFVLNNRMGLLRKDMNDVENETSAKITDSFFNVDAVTAFDNSEFEVKRYDTSLKKGEVLALKNEWLYVLLNVGQNAIFMTGLTVMLLMCGKATIAGVLTIGSFAMLSSMLYQLWQPLSYLGWQYREVKQSLIDLQNLFQLLQRQPVIKDAPDAKELVVTGGEITFKGISFKYPEDSDLELEFIRKPTEVGSMQELSEDENGAAGNGRVKEVRHDALTDVSFTVAPGKSLALVGSSGSGKSSALRLLYRLYDVSKGTIEIDGQDISTVTLSSLRQSIGIVPQDAVLFNDTIAYNLRYARPSATDEEVVAAAKAASIHETIIRTPQGYDTLVGERGIKLSGGERQRVAIARSIIRNPKILLLDEPTSALDAVSEKVVQDALDHAARGRTTIIVAHRLSTVRNADSIAVVHKGRIVEQGTHNELLARNGRYAELVKNQMENPVPS